MNYCHHYYYYIQQLSASYKNLYDVLPINCLIILQHFSADFSEWELSGWLFQGYLSSCALHIHTSVIVKEMVIIMLSVETSWMFIIDTSIFTSELIIHHTSCLVYSHLYFYFSSLLFALHCELLLVFLCLTFHKCLWLWFKLIGFSFHNFSSW